MPYDIMSDKRNLNIRWKEFSIINKNEVVDIFFVTETYPNCISSIQIIYEARHINETPIWHNKDKLTQ